MAILKFKRSARGLNDNIVMIDSDVHTESVWKPWRMTACDGNGDGGACIAIGFKVRLSSKTKDKGGNKEAGNPEISESGCL